MTIRLEKANDGASKSINFVTTLKEVDMSYVTEASTRHIVAKMLRIFGENSLHFEEDCETLFLIRSRPDSYSDGRHFTPPDGVGRYPGGHRIEIFTVNKQEYWIDVETLDGSDLLDMNDHDPVPVEQNRIASFCADGETLKEMTNLVKVLNGMTWDGCLVAQDTIRSLFVGESAS